MAKRRSRIETAGAGAGWAWLAAHREQLVQAAVIFAASLWIYWPALNGGLIWDDGWYITTNPLLHDWTGLGKFWFSPGSWVEYYPIHETALWLQYQLWGENPLGYHLVSLALHILNSLLVWRLLSRFGLRLAWIGGLLFAVSSVQVMSVAWISELKNTISQPFALLAMISWINYEEKRQEHDYRRALLFYFISMLCKITMAPFPFVLVLYAWWKRGRLDFADLKRIAPFLVVAVALAVTTQVASIIYSVHGYVQDVIIPIDDPFTRLARAGVLWWYYLGSTLFPVDILPLYPKWVISAGSAAAWLPLLALVVLTAWCWIRRRTWGRHVLLGLGFFGLNLLPFLGFNGISYMLETWIEIHLLYLPVVGVIGLVVAGVEDLGHKLPAPVRLVPQGVTALVAVALVWGARSFAGWFAGEETFWTRTIQHDPVAWNAYQDLGCYMIHEERYPEAIELLTKGIALLPGYDFGYYNLGIAMEKSGRTEEATVLYRKAISLNPRKPNAYHDLGEDLRREGKIEQAEQTFREGLKFAPDSESLAVNLAGILFDRGQFNEAIQLYDHAAESHPDDAQLQYDYASALLQAGNPSVAREHFANAVELDPHLAVAHQGYGTALAQVSHLPEAIDEFQAALAIDPTLGPARDNLARALVQSGRIPEAIEQFQTVLQYHPDDAQAQQNLARLQQYQLQNPAASSPR